MSEIVPILKPSHSQEDLIYSFADFLKIDAANGDARPDTIKTYQMNISKWFFWCQKNNINPVTVTSIEVKAFRKELIDLGMQHSTISLKLTILRRFYQAAVDRGLISKNPVDGIKAPRERKAKEPQMKYLTAGEAELLFRSIPSNGSLKSYRDKAMLALMAIEGLRTVEITRANVTDIETLPDNSVRVLIHGKGKDGYIYPREDTVEVTKKYLQTRVVVYDDTEGTPLFTAMGNKAGGRRITRDGVRSIVNKYLISTDLKRPGLSCHALRHTCGSLLYQATRDLRVVQETLRHSDISMAARYSHIVDRGKARYTKEIQIKI